MKLRLHHVKIIQQVRRLGFVEFFSEEKKKNQNDANSVRILDILGKVMKLGHYLSKVFQVR